MRHVTKQNKTKQNKQTKPAKIMNIKFHFATFYQKPVDIFPCQLQAGNNERFTAASTDRTYRQHMTVGGRTFRPDVVLLPHTAHFILNTCRLRNNQRRASESEVVDCVRTALPGHSHKASVTNSRLSTARQNFNFLKWINMYRYP